MEGRGADRKAEQRTERELRGGIQDKKRMGWGRKKRREDTVSTEGDRK